MERRFYTLICVMGAETILICFKQINKSKKIWKNPVHYWNIIFLPCSDACVGLLYPEEKLKLNVCLHRGLLLIHAGADRRQRHSGGRVTVQSQVEEMASPESSKHGQQQSQSGARPGTFARGARGLSRPAVCRGHGQQLPDRGRRWLTGEKM